tara:strand:+ start:66913 stop:67323 length:411 start_codon:yes stop_codon:yes gene_type:complete
MKGKDCGLIFLRIGLGVVFIMHGSQKLFGAFGGGGISGTAQFLDGLGFPIVTFFAWVLALVEFLGGIGILVGVLIRTFSFLIMIDMFLAFLLVHVKNGFFLDNRGYEFVFMLFFAALAIFLMKSKKVSLSKSEKKE